MTRKLKRVSGYNPRFIVWWLKGVHTPTPVTFPTRRIATRIRQDMYGLRKAMVLENHYAAPLADKAEIIQRPVSNAHTGPDDPHDLIVRPAGFDVNAVLDDANIHEPEEGEDLTAGIRATDPSTALDYANLMRPTDET